MESALTIFSQPQGLVKPARQMVITSLTQSPKTRTTGTIRRIDLFSKR